ncbi:MAG: HAD-IB family phosphatase [Actinomycetota bacterium]
MATAFCIDLDGTLVSTPLVPLVASASDIAEEIEVLTAATEQGAIPFARSLRLRCRLLRDVPLSEARRRVGYAAVNEDMLAFVRLRHDRCFVLTGAPDCWVAPLAERFGCEIISSRARTEGDHLVDLEMALDKGDAVRGLRARFETIVAVGSSVNDLPMFEAADVRVAYGFDLAPGIRETADYWTTSGRALCRLLTPL